jgi:hypothetical protein
MSSVPLDQSSPNRNQIVVDNHTVDPSQPQPVVNVQTVSPDAFRTLGIPLVRGRGIAASDRPDRPKVAVISQSMAKHFFGDENPVGHHIASPADKQQTEIVGVAGDVRQYGLDHELVDTVYVPLAQNPSSGGAMVLRATGDSMNLVNAVRRTIQGLNPEQAIVDVKTLDELRDASILQQRITTVLLALFAGRARSVSGWPLARRRAKSWRWCCRTARGCCSSAVPSDCWPRWPSDARCKSCCSK